MRRTLTAILLASLAAAGCRSRGQPVVVSQRTSPGVHSTQQGLELWTWAVSDARRQLPSLDPTKPSYIIRDDKTDIESLLAPYLGNPVPMPDEARSRWRAAGLRIVAVPRSDLDRLLSASRLTGQAQRQWLGQVAEWDDAVRPVPITGPKAVALADGVMMLEPGRLRLPLRAWLVPDASSPSAAALHVELSPRLEPHIGERERLAAAAQGRHSAPPMILQSLVTSIAASGDDAYVIVSDAPGADWARPAPPAEAESIYGPPTPVPASFGELLLSIPASESSPRLRVVIALVARVPDRFEVIR